MPVVFNRRLYLFWATINEAAIEEPPPHIPALPQRPQASRPMRYYEVHLAWTQLRDSGWAPKKVATDYIGRDLSGLRTLEGLRADVRADDLSSPSDFFFRALAVNAPAASTSGQDLIIQPIRYRPSRLARQARIARMRGDGPGGFDDGPGGFEPPPPDPIARRSSRRPSRVRGGRLLPVAEIPPQRLRRHRHARAAQRRDEIHRFAARDRDDEPGVRPGPGALGEQRAGVPGNREDRRREPARAHVRSTPIPSRPGSDG